MVRLINGLAATLVLAFGVLVHVGCSDTGDDTTATSSGSMPTNTFGKSDCWTCVKGADGCAPQIETCSADPECAGYLTCLEGCAVDKDGNADVACTSACPTGTGSEAKKAIAELDTCREKGAGASCSACGVVPITMYTSPVLNQVCTTPSVESNVCYICEDEKCCDSYAKCAANAECQALKMCLVDCFGNNGMNCQKTCTEQHPQGVADFGAKVACTVVICAADQPMCDRSQRDPCEACLFETCADEYATFLDGPEGYALEGCIGACPMDDAVCGKKCYDAYPLAAERSIELGACVTVACAGKC